MTNTFHIYNAGDPSVGIFPYHANVSFSDDLGEWDQDMIDSAKQALADIYDTPLNSIMTEQEYLDECNRLLEREKTLNHEQDNR